jgi:type VI secretion system protein ImpG
MADELLPYYEKELAFIRQLGTEFAKENPKIAGRLGINNETIEDPHASRLIESFAYLNARIQHKLDDEFPELTDALINCVYPHYQRPIPALSVVQCEPDKAKLDAPFLIPRHTLLETPQFNGETCRFRTVYDTTMLPISVSHASLMGRPFTTPGAAQARGAASVLKLCLQGFTADVSFGVLAPPRIRFYLKGQAQYTHPLYQLLLGECLQVVMTTSAQDTKPIYLSPDIIKAVGFSQDDGLFPYPENSFIGYRLLTEFFTYAEKFMFVDIELGEKISPYYGQNLELYIYFKQADLELEHQLGADMFALNCTPIINLFPHKCDPIKLDHTQMEYPVIPDARRPMGYEIYAIQSVTAINTDGDASEFLPFYGLNHRHEGQAMQTFWFATRRHAKLGNLDRDDGTDMYLSLVDLNFNPNAPDNRILSIESLASNRDQPSKLPFNSEQPALQCVNAAPPCSRIRCLLQPTPAVRPPLGNKARWRLISHLNLNYLSLTGSNDSTEAFKEILRLYDFRETSVTRALIDSILQVKARPISAPLSIDGLTTLCRGVEIEVTLDAQLLSGSSSYLYATVLEHFFAVYCSLNSFTRTLVKIKNKEGYLKKCPPRSGEKILL